MSTDIESAVVLDAGGAVVAFGPGPVSIDVGTAVSLLWDAAAEQAGATSDSPLEHLFVAAEEGAVMVLSGHGHRIVALTCPRPAVGLLLFDLRTCLGDAFAGEEAIA